MDLLFAILKTNKINNNQSLTIHPNIQVSAKWLQDRRMGIQRPLLFLQGKGFFIHYSKDNEDVAKMLYHSLQNMGTLPLYSIAKLLGCSDESIKQGYPDRDSFKKHKANHQRYIMQNVMDFFEKIPFVS